MAAFLGFAGSFHCLGMCAPIFWALKAQQMPWWQPLLYHAGRLLAYTFMGAVIGLLGQAFVFTGWQEWLAYFSGLAFMLLGIFAANLDTVIFKIPGFKGFYEAVAEQLGAMMQHRGSLVGIGFLNGLLPCGLVYMALFGALSIGSPLEGGLYMACFGTGTLPMMLGAAWAGSLVTPKWRQSIRKAYPVMFVALGLLMLYRGNQLPAYQGKDSEQGVLCVP